MLPGGSVWSQHGTGCTSLKIAASCKRYNVTQKAASCQQVPSIRFHATFGIHNGSGFCYNKSKTVHSSRQIKALPREARLIKGNVPCGLVLHPLHETMSTTAQHDLPGIPTSQRVAAAMYTSNKVHWHGGKSMM